MVLPGTSPVQSRFAPNGLPCHPKVPGARLGAAPSPPRSARPFPDSRAHIAPSPAVQRRLLPAGAGAGRVPAIGPRIRGEGAVRDRAPDMTSCGCDRRRGPPARGWQAARGGPDGAMCRRGVARRASPPARNHLQMLSPNRLARSRPRGADSRRAPPKKGVGRCLRDPSELMWGNLQFGRAGSDPRLPDREFFWVPEPRPGGRVPRTHLAPARLPAADIDPLCLRARAKAVASRGIPPIAGVPSRLCSTQTPGALAVRGALSCAQRVLRGLPRGDLPLGAVDFAELSAGAAVSELGL